MPRLFVAVWPSEPVAEALAALPRPTVTGVRWTRPAQWHVTLRFFGEVDADAASSALAGVHHDAVSARLGSRVERFDRGAMVVGVEGLDSLAAAVVAATREVGRPPDRRRFRGHLTLARCQGESDVHLDVSDLAAGPWSVRSISLVQSQPGPGGSRYTVLEEVELT